LGASTPTVPGPVAQIGLALLGPLRLEVDATFIDVPGMRRRAVLARLALARTQVVAVGVLVEDLWPGEEPDNARRALHSHLSRLRRHLGPAADRLTRVGDGYRLRLEAGELDIANVEEGVTAARELIVTEPTRAMVSCRAMLACWRGPPLVDFADLPTFAPYVTWLTELQRRLVDCHLDACLAAGDDREVVPAAWAAAAAEPLREYPVRVLMTGLAHTGRSAEALRAGHDFRRRLADVAGLDPTPSLAELEHRIASGRQIRSSDHGVTAPPTPGTDLVGRRRELGELWALLASAGLVTIVGPAGVGKTRLAVEAATHDRGERTVAFAELTSCIDGADLASHLASALGLRPSGATPPLTMVKEALQESTLLLVVDNCEHVWPACRELLPQLVEAAPQLTLLATSREALDVPGETRYRVQPLSVPPEQAGAVQVWGSDAGRLFLARAQRVVPDLTVDDRAADAVATIVRRLDGLPLAIELAAGRLGALALADLATRLDDSLAMLYSGRPRAGVRHNSLASTLDLSYRLLDEPARKLFTALGVFVDGFDIAAVEIVGNVLELDVDPLVALARLVDASLVEAQLDAEPPRYRMLQTMRLFALDRLRDTETDTATEVAVGHAERAARGLGQWASTLAASLYDDWGSPADGGVMHRLRLEQANLRAAHSQARAQGDLDLLVHLTTTLGLFLLYGDFPELQDWTVELAADPRLIGHREEATVCGRAASAAVMRGQLDLADHLAQRSCTLRPAGQAHPAALDALVTAALYRGQWDEAIRLSMLMAASGGDAKEVAIAECGAAMAATYAGDPERARALLAPTVDAVNRLGSVALASVVHFTAGEIDSSLRPPVALAEYRQAVELAVQSGASFLEGVARVGLVSLQAASGDHRAALAGYAALIEHWRRTGMWTQQWTTLRNLAALLGALDDPATALLLIEAAAHSPDAPDLGSPAASDLDHLAGRCAAVLDPLDAAALHESAATISGTQLINLALRAINDAEVALAGRRQAPTPRYAEAVSDGC
jgi:predicted ATPase/DNA-binding SARP family transcriptional activator